MEVKDYLRPPFSNYDVVVYFGCGLFFIPFINRYLFGPMELNWPTFKVSTGTAVGDSVVSFLALSFCIYIVGHIIAYISSQLIEKWSDTIIGKISSVILSISDSKPGLQEPQNSQANNREYQKDPSPQEHRRNGDEVSSSLRAVFNLLDNLFLWCFWTVQHSNYTASRGSARADLPALGNSRPSREHKHAVVQTT